MRLMEYGSPLNVIPFSVLPVLDSEAIFKVPIDPHFTDDVTVQRQI
jgi:hypothetical protein